MDKDLTIYVIKFAPYEDIPERQQFIARYNKSGKLKYLEYDVDKIYEKTPNGREAKDLSDKVILYILSNGGECFEVKK